MNPAHKFGAKRRVNGTVAGDARHWRKDGGGNRHPEMRLAAFVPPAMAAMLFALIGHCQRLWGKSVTQPRMYFIGNPHFSQSAPSIPRPNL